MPRIHFLNVGEGDCSIIQHSSDRVRMIDICGGNAEEQVIKATAAILESLEPSTQPKGDYGYVLNNHSELVVNCAVLIAPHHGRDSEMDFSFLAACRT